MQNMRSSICGREAGFIVGETNPLEFTFVSSKELLPPRLEYLVVPGVEERGGGGVPTSEFASTQVDVLAQVVEIGIASAEDVWTSASHRVSSKWSCTYSSQCCYPRKYRLYCL